MRVAVIGDGQMGRVLADALIHRGIEVRLWGPFEDVVQQLATTRENPRRMPGFHLRSEAMVSVDAGMVMDSADLLVNAIPAQFIRDVWSRVADSAPQGAPIVSVAKGIEMETLMRPSEVLADVLPSMGAACALSGPTIAAELAAHKPAVMVAASEDASVASVVQDAFDVPWLRVYTGSDIIGVELAGACKNVIAIAAGLCDGMQLGDNAKSAILARGLVEITRLGEAMSARRDTFYGLAGAGDLATTCFSPHGRNRSCGEAIGQGVSLKAHQAESDSVVEGVATTRSLLALAQRHDVEMPIVEVVHAVLFEELAPQSAVRQLMDRQFRSESE